MDNFAVTVLPKVTMAPLVLDIDPFPSYAWAVCMLMGVGFAVSAAGVLRSAAAQRRAARASQSG